jgi:hypothetical protein
LSPLSIVELLKNLDAPGSAAATTILCLGVLCFFLPNTQELVGENRLRIDGTPTIMGNPAAWILSWRPSAAWAIAIGLLGGLSVVLMKNDSPFLYFQF